MKRKPIAVALALALAICMGATPAWAYFTWNDQAAGGSAVHFTPRTQIHEQYLDGQKTVTITNAEDAGPALVRARVYASTAFSNVTAEGAGWTPSSQTVKADSGWIYCNEVLPAGGTTAELKVTFDFPKQESPDPDAPYVISDGENYSVVVVYEASPVLYDAQGNAYANWDNAEEGGN